VKRRTWLNIVRLLVSGGLLAWVLTQVGVADLLATVRNADARLLALAGLLSAGGVVLRAWRWEVLLRAVGARVPFRRLVYLYYVSQFFSSFLPTGFAGDVVRVLETGEGASSTQSAGTVLVERLTGFIGLFLLALLALPFSGGLIPREWAWAIAGLSAAVIGGSLVLFEGRLLRRITGWLPGGLSLASGSWLARTYDVIAACGARAILSALGIATLFNLVQIGFNLALARALGIQASALYFALFIPIATVALLVPISISGLGVREQIYLTLFASPAVGLTDAQAVALSLGAYGLDFVNAIIGGVLYLGAGAAGLRGGGQRMGNRSP
jgi:uncharacterized membrane protein YbhN (UPF0104 family)